MKSLFPTLNTLSLMMVALSTVSHTTSALAVEPLPYKKTITTYSAPDSYGRVATTTTTTDLFPADAANITRQEQLKTITTRTFVTPDLTNKWSQQDLVLCQNQAITQKTNGVPDNAINQRNAWRYDTKGRVWKEITEPTAAECIQEGNTALAGRLVSETTYKPLGGVDTQKILSGLNVAARTTASYNYDVTGTYASSTTNALSQSTSQVMSISTNTLSSQTDINGLQSTWQYDSFGRETIELSPEGIQTKTTYSWCDGDSSCPTLAKYQIKVETTKGAQTVSPTTISYYDALERPIKEKIQWNASAWIVTSYKVYNTLGQLDKEATPYFEGDATIYWTNYRYDVLGRVQVVQTTTGSSTVAYDVLKTVATNEKKQTKTTLIGLHGQPRKIIDAEGNTLSTNYSPLGLTATTMDAKGNIRNYVYDNLGNKLKDKDPDLGEWTYTYDGLNETKTQIDAKTQSTSYDYDLLGRMTHRLEADLNSYWEYDTATGLGKGQLKRSYTLKADGTTDYERTYAYDNFGRLVTDTTTKRIDPTATASSPDFVYNTTYDTVGRIDTLTYPTGVGYRKVYNAYGYMSEVRNKADNTLFWRLDARNAAGQITQETLGNGLVTRRTYKPATGYVDTIATGTLNGTSFIATAQNNSYTFDNIGNLNTRTEAFNNISEAYIYDSLNRLVQSTMGSTIKTVKYDALGRIYYKSDVGNYSYGQNITLPNPSYTPNWTPYNTWIPIGMGNGLPIFVWGAVSPPSPTLTVASAGTCGGIHRVCNIAGSLNTSFIYDNNGNMSTGNGRSYTWNSFNMPKTITQGTTVSESFVYDANHERVKRTSTDNGSTTTTLYINPRLDLGGTFEKNINPDNSIEYVHHLYAGGQVLGSVVTKSNYSSPTALWSTDLTTAPTTTSPNATGLTLPAVDTNGLIAWDNTTGNGRLAFTTKPTTVGINVIAMAQRSYLNDNVLFKAEVTTTTNTGNGRYLLMEVYNGGSDAAASKTNRRHGVYFRGGNLYAYYSDGLIINSTTGNLSQTTKTLGAAANNTTYVAEVETTPLSSTLYVYPKGQTRGQGYSHSLDMDWRSLNGTGTLTRRMRVFAYGSTTESVNVTYLDNVSESTFTPLGTRYFHADHLGSISAITNSAGAVIERLSYDAWGNRRAMTGLDASGIKGTMSKHGFTGHEELDTVGLVHMNGRVYDPVVARFVSADPNVFYPDDLQDYNVYSYVHNNPLSATDPSGYMWFGTEMFEAMFDYDSPISDYQLSQSNSIGGYWSSTSALQASIAQSSSTYYSPTATLGIPSSISNNSSSTTTSAVSSGSSNSVNNMTYFGTPDSSVPFISGLARLRSMINISAAQTVADVASATEVPIVSQVAGIASAVISVAQGDYTGAGLSMAGVVPIFGAVADATKLGRNVEKAVDAANSRANIPTLGLSRTEFPNHTAMLENAQKAGHSLEGLTRGAGRRAAEKNRYESQKQIRKDQGPPPKNHDYDEFPYASTEQGGKGAHIEPVLSAENQAAGRRLGGFYHQHGIKAGDAFNIKIIE